jgi:hypothetical protein
MTYMHDTQIHTDVNKQTNSNLHTWYIFTSAFPLKMQLLSYFPELYNQS